MTQATLPGVFGRATEVLAELGDRVRLHDLYDETGVHVYHDLAAGDTGEIRELLLALKRVDGPVLELAAGSGRLTLPMLAVGREVTALELSADMLDLLRTQLTTAPRQMRERCELLQGDMSAFDLGRRFGAIVLGTTSVSLLDEAGRAGLFAAVRAHLEPGGRLLMSTVNLVDDAAGDSDLEIRAVGISGTHYRVFENWPAGSLVRTVTILAQDTGAEHVLACTTAIRVLPVELLQEELARAGLVVRERIALPVPSPRHTEVLLEVEAI